MTLLRVGSRESPLAIEQANEAMAQINDANGGALHFQLIATKTTGDLNSRPFSQINQENMFTKEVEEMLLQNKIDVAIHSMKDVPVVMHPDLELVSTFREHDHRDAMVSFVCHESITDLPMGCRVGTASARRKAQLLRLRPDINVINLRGNIVTRLDKLRDGHADVIILAAAGLDRLGVVDPSYVPIPVELMLPSAGQGILVAQTRKDDHMMRTLVMAANDDRSWKRCQVERQFLRLIGAGCGDPVAAFASVDSHDLIDARFMILSRDGSSYYETRQVGVDPMQIAVKGAESLINYVDIWN